LRAPHATARPSSPTAPRPGSRCGPLWALGPLLLPCGAPGRRGRPAGAQPQMGIRQPYCKVPLSIPWSSSLLAFDPMEFTWIPFIFIGKGNSLPFFDGFIGSITYCSKPIRIQFPNSIHPFPVSEINTKAIQHCPK